MTLAITTLSIITLIGISFYVTVWYLLPKDERERFNK